MDDTEWQEAVKTLETGGGNPHVLYAIILHENPTYKEILDYVESKNPLTAAEPEDVQPRLHDLQSANIVGIEGTQVIGEESNLSYVLTEYGTEVIEHEVGDIERLERMLQADYRLMNRSK
jgi:hypothetical protein